MSYLVFEHHNTKINQTDVYTIFHTWRNITTIQTDVIESICDEIANLDSKIRFVGIIDTKGRLLAQNKNDKLNTILSIQELETLLAEIALWIRMERDHDEHFGAENFVISYGSKVISIIFPLHKEIVCVFTHNEINVVKTENMIPIIATAICTLLERGVK